MSEEHEVIGIFLERTGGVLLSAIASFDSDKSERWKLRFTGHKTLTWNSRKPKEAKDGVRRFAEIAWAHHESCKSIAVSCNGPFVSLNVEDLKYDKDLEVYGALSPDSGHLPFRGQSIPKIFREVFDKKVSDGWAAWMKNSETRFRVWHDSNASALGEALSRETADHEITAHLSVTEGVGLGMVCGRQFVQTAHHPEIGLMPVQPNRRDILFKPGQLPISPLHTVGLAELTDNKSLRTRLEIRTGKKNPTLRDLKEYDRDDIWDMRAFYLAQACLACLVVHPPKKIIIGAQIDPRGDVAERTTRFFQEIMERREKNGQPIPHYPALDNDYQDLIEPPKALSMFRNFVGLAYTGAAGMCYAAADALSPSRPYDTDEKQ